MTYSARYVAKLARYRERLNRRSSVAANKRRKPRARVRRRLAGAALGRCHYRCAGQFKASNLRCENYVPKRGRLYCDAHFKVARAAAISRGLKLYHENKRLQLTAERDIVWSRSGSGDEWMGSLLL